MDGGIGLLLAIVFGYLFLFVFLPVHIAGTKGASRILWLILALLFGPLALVIVLGMPYKPQNIQN